MVITSLLVTAALVGCMDRDIESWAERKCATAPAEVEALRAAWNAQVATLDPQMEAGLHIEQFAEYGRVTETVHGTRGLFRRDCDCWKLVATWPLGQPLEDLRTLAPGWSEAYLQQHSMCHGRAERRSIALTAASQMKTTPRVWRVGDDTLAVARDPKSSVCAVLYRDAMGEWTIERYVRGVAAADAEFDRAKEFQRSIQATLNATDLAVHIQRHCR